MHSHAHSRYVEVLGDGPALAATNAALKTASGLVGFATRGAENTTGGFGMLYKLSFDQYELCSNYGLDLCDTPTPTNQELGYEPPYPGMVADGGIWYFKDRIEYEADGAYYKIKITFGHDPRADVRSKVIMMSVDETEFVEYDQIERIVVTDDGEIQTSEVKLSMTSVPLCSRPPPHTHLSLSISISSLFLSRSHASPHAFERRTPLCPGTARPTWRMQRTVTCR